ncbi:MAG: S-layer homology domain-containing protein [bacterium]|nr:S-layer homology domain-containing protein [bacterium]
MELRVEVAGGRATGRGRRTVAALLAGALIASASAFGPVPARATDGVADHLPAATACTGAATKSAGFLDTLGLVAEPSINCLAHYGITAGTAPNIFMPESPVTRWQMALFLVRAAPLAGVDLSPPIDQGFVDIGGLRPAAQDAINQLASLGITRGSSPTTFSPNSLVNRSQMALLLHRFLLQSAVGPGGVRAASVSPDDTTFSDIGGLSGNVNNAIRVLFEMGVTSGTSATTYSPSSIVTRAQMAIFIARMLAHTNARPAGVTMHAAADRVSSGDTLIVHVSVRDSNRRPVARGYVDMFTTPLSRPLASFDSDGLCVNNMEAVFGELVCRIDQLDQQLDDRGNLLAVLQPTDHMMLWAWTGSVGNTFALGGVPTDMVRISVWKHAVAVDVLDDLPPTAIVAPMGETIEVTVRLVDEHVQAVEDQGVRVQVSTTLEINGIRQRKVVRTYLTDDKGRVELSFTGMDPSSARVGDTVRMDLDVDAGFLDVQDRTTPGVVTHDAVESRDVWFTWSDAAPRTSTLRLAQTVPYHVLPASAPGPTNLIRALLTDQYGSPVPDARIDFTSDDMDGIGSTRVARPTDQRGIAVLRYLWSSSDAAAERITARLAGSDLAPASIRHFWVKPESNGASSAGAVIHVADTQRNQIVVGHPTPRVISYTGRDRFLLEGRSVTPAVFEEALDAGFYGRITYTGYSTDPQGVSSFDLTNSALGAG